MRRSTKLACLLACAVLCCASSAQEIDFQDKVAKPYIIAYNNRKYQFCPVDLNILKCEKFADICESFFQFHILKYQCNRQEVSLIEKMRKLDSPDDVVANWGRYSNFGPSNMQRIEDKEFVIWKFGQSSSRATETLFGQKPKIN